MMNSGQSSGAEPAVDPDSDFPADLDTWIDNFIRDLDVGINEDDTPFMPIADAGINFGEGSSNVQMMASRFGMTPRSGIGSLHGSGQNILSSAIKTISNHNTAQSLQSHVTNFNQYQPQHPTQIYRNQSLQPLQPTNSYHNQPLMQQGFNNNYVQQPQTHSFTNQSNITFNDHMTNSLKYQMPSNQLLPYTVQMVNYEPLHQSFNALSVQLPNQPQMATNVETNMVNFNQNFSSRIPVGQQSRMPSSPNNTSFQIGIDQRPKNPMRIDPSIVSPSDVMIPKQHTNSEPNTSRVIGPVSPIDFLSNQAAANQPRFLNSEKMKQPVQPVHKTNEFAHSRACAGLSPLGSRLVNHYTPSQLLVPSSHVNPINQQSSVTSETVDENSVLTPQAMTRSSYLLSSSSTFPSGKSLMTTVENQKLATPIGTPCQKPQTSKDPIPHLSLVGKSVSPKALSSSSNYMPTNVVGQYVNIDTDNEPRPNMRRELSIPSMLNHRFDLPEGAIYSIHTASNQKPKLENEWALLEEIKEINSKLMETIVFEVLDPSEENITLIGGHDGVILKCLFRNVRFSDLLDPYESDSSEKMSEFAIMFLLPFDYPASSTRVFKSEQDLFNCELRWKLYKEMITRFDNATSGIRGKLFVRELASNWDASACAVMSEFSQKLGGKSFSFWYGSWESCLNGSSGSN